MLTHDTTPNPVDLYVGSRVRLRRKLQGRSQTDLASALDLTFQQVQKYERGSNRVSASKLYEIGKFLEVPVTYFFDGYETGENDQHSTSDTINSFLRTAEGIQLAQAFPRIVNSKHRRKVLELVQSLVNEAH